MDQVEEAAGSNQSMIGHVAKKDQEVAIEAAISEVIIAMKETTTALIEEETMTTEEMAAIESTEEMVDAINIDLTPKARKILLHLSRTAETERSVAHTMVHRANPTKRRRRIPNPQKILKRTPHPSQRPRNLRRKRVLQ